MKLSRSDKLFDAINYLLLSCITLVVIYPLYFIIIASISEPSAVATGQVYFWPVGFSLDAYKYTLESETIWTGYFNTIIYTIAGTAYNLFFTIPAAYVLSKKNFPFKKLLTTYFFITMYISGGLIPNYILRNELGLINTRWVLILGTGLTCYNLIVARQYFANTIPDEVYEAAEIDGASQFKVFTSIAIPLSGAIIAIMGLFYGVGHWNNYSQALIYIRSADLYPLQLVLRVILLQGQSLLSGVDQMSSEEILSALALLELAEAMKYAVIFVASAPLLAVYPFVQKFFVKGVMVGSIKG